MKRCDHCKRVRESQFFYPNALSLRTAWCKACIDKKRIKGVKAFRLKAQQAGREQAAIRAVVKQFQVDGSPFVYLLEADNRLKIGFSTDVESRLRALDTARDIPHTLVAVVPGGRERERGLHRRFQHFRVAREWFARRIEIVHAFKEFPGALVFLPGCITQEPPPPSVVTDLLS